MKLQVNDVVKYIVEILTVLWQVRKRDAPTYHTISFFETVLIVLETDIDCDWSIKSLNHKNYFEKKKIRLWVETWDRSIGHW